MKMIVLLVTEARGFPMEADQYILKFEIDYKNALDAQVKNKGVGPIDRYDLAKRMIIKGWRKHEQTDK